MPKQAVHHGQERAAGASPADSAFPFVVELWDHDKQRVERTLAFAATGGTAFAAFHATISEYPSRYITLRRDGRIVSRANAPAE